MEKIVTSQEAVLKDFSMELQRSAGFNESYDCGPFVIFMLQNMQEISNAYNHEITLKSFYKQAISFQGRLPYDYKSSKAMGQKLREKYLVLYNEVRCEESFDENSEEEYNGNVKLGGLSEKDIKYNLKFIQENIDRQNDGGIFYVEHNLLNKNNVVDLISTWKNAANSKKHFLSIITIVNNDKKKYAVVLHVENFPGFLKVQIIDSLSDENSEFKNQLSEIQKLLSVFPGVSDLIFKGSQDQNSATCCDQSLHQLMEIYEYVKAEGNVDEDNDGGCSNEIVREQYFRPVANLNFAYDMNIKKQVQAEYAEAKVMNGLNEHINNVYFSTSSHFLDF